MNIQWQLLLTHAIGFLITLWILKKFAWRPLLSMMEERRQKIIGEFKKIEDDRADVQQLAAQYDAKLKEIDNERRAKLVEAVNEGKALAEEIKAAAHTEARQITERAKGEIQQDIAKARVQLKNDMVSLTVAAAEKIIHEKLDDDKHRKLIGDYIDDLEKV
jgi:F-type H+-transporting ATPase subunit b